LSINLHTESDKLRGKETSLVLIGLWFPFVIRARARLAGGFATVRAGRLKARILGAGLCDAHALGTRRLWIPCRILQLILRYYLGTGGVLCA
jgi:hypothetical protein